MIKIENTTLPSSTQWERIIFGMRSPKNSWDRIDSVSCDYCEIFYCDCEEYPMMKIGPNDHKLMMSLAKGGPVHAKYRRMITVYLDITAPLYWWKEFDTYKIGTVANSCSTMHKIHDKEFTLDDFSHEHLLWSDDGLEDYMQNNDYESHWAAMNPAYVLEAIIGTLNYYRERYLTALKTKEETGLSAKDIWWQMIQLLPTSYNQKRTVMLNYEVLHNIYHSRKDHKLDEWHTLCEWIENLPYSEIITTPMSRTAMNVNVKNDDTMVKEAIEKVTNGGVILSKEEYEDFLKFKEGNQHD